MLSLPFPRGSSWWTRPGSNAILSKHDRHKQFDIKNCVMSILNSTYTWIKKIKAKIIYLQLYTFCPTDDLSNEYAVTGKFGKLYHNLGQLKTPQVHRIPEYPVNYQNPDALHPLTGLWHYLACHNVVLLAALATEVSTWRLLLGKRSNDRAGLKLCHIQGPALSPMRDAKTGQWTHQRNRCLLLCHKQNH